ncbi:ubiquilin-like protein [Perognathus longimembris pacificus]|uniref:ubiquilin-like protein n=1 Tax=Perognathus longimembris pacificus TaxID=214514 RepID=UPI002018D7FF|nr:ubiquilin-like protein [Perognathus longimembris pacificus]
MATRKRRPAGTFVPPHPSAPASTCLPSACPVGRSKPNAVFRTHRVPQNGHPSALPANSKIGPSVSRVKVNTAGNLKDFTLAYNTSVKQLKEKLSAHFNCRTDQIVLVFMGRLLQDQDTLSQRGIADGHTIHLVIRSKNGSRSLANSSQNVPTQEPCSQDRNTKANSNGVYQPAGVSQVPAEPGLPVESNTPKAQNLQTDSSQYLTQVLGNPSIQQLLSNTEFIQQLASGHSDMQLLVEQNPEISHLLDNSEILGQTLELARNLAVMQEIVQLQQPMQNLEDPLTFPPYLGSETIPNRNNAVGPTYADFHDPVLNSTQGLFGGNSFTTLLAGQAQEQVQPTLLPPQPSQGQQDPTTSVRSTNPCGISSIASTKANSNKIHCPARVNTATIKGQSRVGAIQHSVGTPSLPSIAITQKPQEDDTNDSFSLGSLNQKLEGLQLLDEQTKAQITGGMIQLLMNHPHLAAQMMLFLSMPQLSELWRQQLPTLLQQSQTSDLLVALANPKASQAILQIEHGLQLLAIETPILLPWVAPYLWGLGWLPAPSCSYPDSVPWTWDVPEMGEPKKPDECCPGSGAVLQSLQSLSRDPSHPLQGTENRFQKQMETLQAMGFANHDANLQALIANKGDTKAAIRQLKRSQGF